MLSKVIGVHLGTNGGGLKKIAILLWDMARYGQYPEKSIFGSIWQLGWFGMVQNTPTGCGDDLQIILKSSKNHKKYDFLRALF